MDTNIKLIKEISSGFNGTAYLAEYNNIQMIFTLLHILHIVKNILMIIIMIKY